MRNQDVPESLPYYHVQRNMVNNSWQNQTTSHGLTHHQEYNLNSTSGSKCYKENKYTNGFYNVNCKQLPLSFLAPEQPLKHLPKVSWQWLVHKHGKTTVSEKKPESLSLGRGRSIPLTCNSTLPVLLPGAKFHSPRAFHPTIL